MDLATKLKKWQTLFKGTQALPQVKDITDADIVSEVEAYREHLMQHPDNRNCRKNNVNHP